MKFGDLEFGVCVKLDRSVPRKPRLAGGVKGHNIEVITHCREAPRCLPAVGRCAGGSHSSMSPRGANR